MISNFTKGGEKMALFVAKKEKQEILSLLRGIAAAVQQFSDRKLAVGYEETAPMGESMPFYHISYPTSIFDRRQLVSPVNFLLSFLPDNKSRVSPILLALEPYNLKSYQVNRYLTDEAKKAIRSAINKLDPGGSVSEVDFG